MIADFQAYEFELGRRCLIPLLRAQGVDPSGKSVLDVGCGYGGVLAALASEHRLARAVGIDADAGMVEAGRGKCPAGVLLEARDFFSLPDDGFDLILFRDVLEHMPDGEAALRKAARMLNPRGIILASFAPFYSPFGGHQHNAEGFFSRVPWLHCLPEAWFRRALRLRGNSYKSGRALADDMESVLRARLTIAGFRRMAAAAGLRPTYYAGYLSRPDYRLKFGIPSARFPAVPVLDEIFCAGVEALLEKVPGPAGEGRR